MIIDENSDEDPTEAVADQQQSEASLNDTYNSRYSTHNEGIFNFSFPLHS